MPTLQTEHRVPRSSPQRYRFHFIQRLLPGGPWLNGLFHLENVENDQLYRTGPDACVAHIVNRDQVSLHATDITREHVTRPVYFIGPTDSMPAKIEAFRDWFAEPEVRVRRPSRFPDIFMDELPFFIKPHYTMTIAWLSLQDDIFWTLDHTVAHDILDAINRSR